MRVGLPPGARSHGGKNGHSQALDRHGGGSAPKGQSGLRRYPGDPEVGLRQQFLARPGQPARGSRADLEHAESGHGRARTARSPDAGTDLYRRVDNEQLLLLHTLAYGGGPREGDDRRAIFRFSGGGGHGLADKRAGDRPAAAGRLGFPRRELNKEGRSAGPSGTAAADETLDSEMRPIKARSGSLARASFLSDGGSLRCRPCRGLLARRPEYGRANPSASAERHRPSPHSPDGLPTPRSSKERGARPPRGRLA